MRTDPALWERLRASPLDDIDAALSFTQRLSRDNGWSNEFSTRAVVEYKRFVYLACVSSGELTPSDEVDQVWHLHLAYSHHYWDEFCPTVLQRTLHHGPTKGGPSEDKRFEQQYDDTLELYRAEFGAEPPLELWPLREVRFKLAPSYRRVNLERDTVLPRTRVGAMQMIGGTALAAAAVILLLGRQFLGPTGVTVGLAAICILGFLAILTLMRPRYLSAANKRGATGCSGYYYGVGDFGDGGGDAGCGGGGCGGGCGG